MRTSTKLLSSPFKVRFCFDGVMSRDAHAGSAGQIRWLKRSSHGNREHDLFNFKTGVRDSRRFLHVRESNSLSEPILLCSKIRRLFFFNVCAFHGSDLTGFYRSFIQVILKSGPAAGLIEKYRKGNAYAQLRYAHSTALPQSYPASIGSGGATLIFRALIGDGKHVISG